MFHFLARDGSHERVDWMARELIAAAPSRVIWGTDWPHVMTAGIDTGALTGRLSRWSPDKAARDRILVDNPARLYQFQ